MTGRGLTAVGLLLCAGCGVMGAPIPPDTIGVGAVRQQEKRERERQERERQEMEGRRALPPPALAVPAEQPLTPEEAAAAGETAAEELAQPGLRPGGDVLIVPR